MIIHIDIETIPSQKPGALELIRETIRHPGNISKPETIEKWYAENADSAAMEQYRKQSFDGLHGEIISIAWAVGDGDVNVISRGLGDPSSEADLLVSFFFELSGLSDRNGNRLAITRWSGHYITGFDLRFIWQRCVLNGVVPTVKIPYDAKPWDASVFDTKIAWTGSSQYSGAGSLDALSKAFGMEGKGDIDGSKVYDYWLDGRIEEIAEYNKQDVVKCRELYKRMNFINHEIKEKQEMLRQSILYRVDERNVYETPRTCVGGSVSNYCGCKGFEGAGYFFKKHLNGGTMSNTEITKSQQVGGSVSNDPSGGWIDTEKMQPPLITGQDYSANVWGYDATEQQMLIVAFFIDSDGWHWGNAYGEIYGYAEFDDDYDIKYWQPIAIPLPPNA